MPEAIEQQNPAPPQKAKSKIGKIIFIAVIVLVAAAGGGGLSFFIMNKLTASKVAAAEKPEKAEEKAAEMLEKSGAIALEPFVVNLADNDAARYLRIKVSLLIDDKTKLKEIAENQALQLKLRDIMIQTLTAKHSQQLMTVEGKNNLRREIQDKVAIYFRKPKLVDVMFTDFVIQL